MLGTGEVPEIVGALGAAPASRSATPDAGRRRCESRRRSVRKRRGIGPRSLANPEPPSARAPRRISTTPTRRALLTTPRHYAYVKVAEGCDYTCAFCIIPTLRGKYRSRDEDSIVARGASAGGARREELLLISQDTTFFGIDRGERGALARLLRRLNASTGLELDPAALPLPDDDHRRRARRDGGVREGLQVHRPAAAARLGRRPASGCGGRATARPTTSCSRASARACRASRCARRSSSASPARPTQDFEELEGFVARHRLRPRRRLHLLARGRHAGVRAGRRRAGGGQAPAARMR